MTEYRTILTDPPWPHSGGGKRGAQEHYPLLKVHEIAPVMLGSPVWEPHRNCHLWLWVSNNWLVAGLHVMRELNFRYVTNMCWAKNKMGIGHYLRGKHELCLFGVRGKLTPGSRSVWSIHEIEELEERAQIVAKEKRGEHSRKPDLFHELIEQVSPGPRCELFARRAREGWDCWGNEL